MVIFYLDSLMANRQFSYFNSFEKKEQIKPKKNEPGHAQQNLKIHSKYWQQSTWLASMLLEYWYGFHTNHLEAIYVLRILVTLQKQKQQQQRKEFASNSEWKKNATATTNMWNFGFICRLLHIKRAHSIQRTHTQTHRESNSAGTPDRFRTCVLCNVFCVYSVRILVSFALLVCAQCFWQNMRSSDARAFANAEQ